MALTAASGLSAAQKARMERFDPVMDAPNAIPAAIATKTDVDTVISDLLSMDAGKGASQIGIEDSGGLITATTVEGALAELAASSPNTYETVGNITTVNGGDAAAAGVRDTIARGDHQHAVATAAPSANLSGASTNAEGVATSLSRSDHSHAIDAATTTAKGLVELATDGENAANVVVQGNDSRLSDSRTPLAHAASHTNGSDDIQDATNAQKGLATAAHITAVEANTAAIAAAVTDTGGGAGNLGKLVELDGDGKLDGRDVGADGGVLDTVNAAIAAAASTTIGVVRHVKVSTAASPGDTDTPLPPGTWEPVDAWAVNRGAGGAGDTLQFIAEGVGAITDALDIQKADGVITRAGTLNAGVNMVGGTNDLRITVTDGGGGVPACDAHILLRLVA